VPAGDELSPRKRPLQRRSRETVEAILEAGARVFRERDYAGASTNRIAEQAGVSIGSLYEYFPNKDAILVAIAERHVEGMVGEIEGLLARAERSGDRLDRLLEAFVAAMLEVHERDPDLHRILFAEAPHPAALHACVLQMEETLAHSVARMLHSAPSVRVANADASAHLVVQSVEALTHRYVHHGIHDLARETFVAEVVAMLLAYLERAPER
jgi:AcrR family transcriptional regulator